MKRTPAIAVFLTVAFALSWHLSRPQPRPTVAGPTPPAEESGLPEAELLSPLLPFESADALREPAPQQAKPAARPTVEKPEAGAIAVHVRVPIEGLLIVPEAWQRAHLRIELRRLRSPELEGWSQGRDLSQLSHAPGFFPLAFTGEPGEYQLEVPELGYLENFEVGFGGRTDLRFEASAPRIVLVRAFDAATGTARTPDEIEVRWWASGSEARIRTARFAGWDDARGAWRIVTPRSALELSARGAGYLETSLQVPDSQESCEVRIELAAAFELVLTLSERGERIPWNPALRPRLLPAGGQPDHVSVGVSENVCRLVQRAGGPYALEVATPAGYRPIAPVLIQLEGPHTHHTIELVPLR